MVRRDRACNSRPEALDALHGSARRRMLKDDAEPRELRVEFSKVRKEGRLGIQDADIGSHGGGDLAVQIKDHADLFHGGEDGIVGFVRFDAALGVSCDTPRV